jgi:deoxyribodipyrimidine photo-lyase
MLESSEVPAERVRALNDRGVVPERDYVLYWMVASRRPSWSFAVDRAVEWARALERPLLVLEPLRCGYRWASDRHHRFLLDGMAHNARAFARTDTAYYPYVERAPDEGKGLLAALARRAAVVVTDDFPCFFLPRMQAAAAEQVKVRLEAIDGNGLLPLGAAERDYPTAHAFRRYLHGVLPDHFAPSPRARPRLGALRPLPSGSLHVIEKRWPRMEGEGSVEGLPIDHDVAPAPLRGGAGAAVRRWRRFLSEGLARYMERRNLPEEEGTSGLSAYLHFGHLSPHRVFSELTRAEDWDPGCITPVTPGKRQGWWGLSESAEAFLDQLITWRELGFNAASRRADYDGYAALPAWARTTLEKHRGDERSHLYTQAEFAAAETHDPLWNAAQRQLVREGRLHNYLRMLWGKKILEWSRDPREALAIMVELNNRYALDGRDPNSYSGILWVLGRYDRAWGPERPVFGTVRYMSSANTARKFPVRGYLQRYGEG